MIRADSQNARVFTVLADGEPHSAAEIHRRAGFMRLNSRVAELRTKGLVITCEHVGGTGPEAFVYQLQTPLSDGAEKAPERGRPSESGRATPDASSENGAHKIDENGSRVGVRAAAHAGTPTVPLRLGPATPGPTVSSMPPHPLPEADAAASAMLIPDVAEAQLDLFGAAA